MLPRGTYPSYVSETSTTSPYSCTEQLTLANGQHEVSSPLRPGSVLVLPCGTTAGEIALQRGLFSAIQRRWPEADVAVCAPEQVRPLLPEGIGLVTPGMRPHPFTHPFKRVSSTARMLAGRCLPEYRSMSFAMRAFPVHRSRPIAERRRFDVVVDLGKTLARASEAGSSSGEATNLIDRLVEALRNDGFELSERPLEPAPIPRESVAWAERVSLRVPPGPKVLVHPTTDAASGLPLETWRRAIDELCRMGANPLVSSGGSDSDQLLAIEIAADTEAVVLPRVPLLYLVALSRHCHSTVTGDSDLLHLVALDGGHWTAIAAEGGAQMLALYGISRGQLVDPSAFKEPGADGRLARLIMGAQEREAPGLSPASAPADPRAVAKHS
jgi:hypothetical protein